MSEQGSFERFVATQVAGEAGSVPLPEDFYDDIHAYVSRTRQRPVWLALIKEPPMRTNAHLAVGSPTVRVAAILVATLLVSAVLAGASIAGTRLLAADRAIVVAQDDSGTVKTITEAVAMAEVGDTILVRPGIYAEAVVIDKDIIVRGDGELESVVVLGDAGQPSFTLRESSGTLSGVTLREQGILVEGGAPLLDGNLFDHIGLPDGTPGRTDTGVEPIPLDIRGGSTATIRENEFRVSSDIIFDEGSSPLFEDNITSGSQVILWDAGDDTVVRGNTISDAINRGIVVNGPTRALIEGNTLVDVGGTAIVIGWAAGGVGVDPIVRDNVIRSSFTGIEIAAGAAPTIEGNTIAEADIGVLDTGSNATITQNVVSGPGGSGLYVQDGAPTVTNNDVAGMSAGLHLGEDAAPRLEGNSFCGNEDNVRRVRFKETLPDPDLPGNEVCPDGLDEPGE